VTLDDRWRDEQLGNWVSDFLIDDAGQNVSADLAPYAGEILQRFMQSACDHRGSTPDQIGEEDARHGFLEGLAHLDLPATVAAEIPALLRLFVEDLGKRGRLSHAQTVSALIQALSPQYRDRSSGKTPDIQRPAAKIGRNDPCPCGSGKKYKKCCLNLLDG